MYYTTQQVQAYMQQTGATLVTRKDGVEWWKLPDGWWLGVRKFNNGMSEVRKLPPGSCGCGV